MTPYKAEKTIVTAGAEPLRSSAELVNRAG